MSIAYIIIAITAPRRANLRPTDEISVCNDMSLTASDTPWKRERDVSTENRNSGGVR